MFLASYLRFLKKGSIHWMLWYDITWYETGSNVWYFCLVHWGSDILCVCLCICVYVPVHAHLCECMCVCTCSGTFVCVSVRASMLMSVLHLDALSSADARSGYCYSSLLNGRCANQNSQLLTKMQCCCDSGRCWSYGITPEICPARGTGLPP